MSGAAMEAWTATVEAQARRASDLPGLFALIDRIVPNRTVLKRQRRDLEDRLIAVIKTKHEELRAREAGR